MNRIRYMYMVKALLYTCIFYILFASAEFRFLTTLCYWVFVSQFYFQFPFIPNIPTPVTLRGQLCILDKRLAPAVPSLEGCMAYRVHLLQMVYHYDSFFVCEKRSSLYLYHLPCHQHYLYHTNTLQTFEALHSHLYLVSWALTQFKKCLCCVRIKRLCGIK